MARARKIQTGKQLLQRARAYLESISRTVAVKEMVPTGAVDDKGHAILEEREVRNDQGEVIQTREYLIPPTVAGLCLYLGIHRSTWARWCDPHSNLELSEATQWVTAVLRAWNEEQLLTRGDKGVRGIMFNLQNNYGFTQRVEVETGPQTREAQTLNTQEKLELLREVYEICEEEEPDEVEV